MNHDMTYVGIMSVGYDFGLRGEEFDDKVRERIALSVDDNVGRMLENSKRGEVDL